MRFILLGLLTALFLSLSLQTSVSAEPLILSDQDGEVVFSVQGSVSDNEKRMESLRRRAKMSARGSMIVERAKKYIGVPYRWAGTNASGFDCSGFVMAVYKEMGLNLSRMADSQYYQGQKISKQDLSVGDLVFFSTYTSGVSHVGIYVGENRFIHASSSKGVIIDSLDDPYYRARYVGSCRY